MKTYDFSEYGKKTATAGSPSNSIAATAAVGLWPATTDLPAGNRQTPGQLIIDQAFVPLSRIRAGPVTSGVTQVRSDYSLYSDLIFPQVDSFAGTVAQTSDVIPIAGYSS